MVLLQDTVRHLYATYLKPYHDKVSNVAMMNHLQEAYWFYIDNLHMDKEDKEDKEDREPKKFTEFIHTFVPYLKWKHSSVNVLLKEYWLHSQTVPRAGGILMNSKKTKLVLVRAPNGKKWGFPVGKIREAEPLHLCAQREVFEETGFQCAIPSYAKPFEYRKKKAIHSVFVAENVPEEYAFTPMSSKEIGEVKWFDVSELETVLPKKLVHDLLNFLRIYVFSTVPALCNTDQAYEFRSSFETLAKNIKTE